MREGGGYAEGAGECLVGCSEAGWSERRAAGYSDDAG
jgi:hypothetical protein